MVLASPKNLSQMAVFPKALLSIAASAGGLALFLIIASMLLLSHPIGSRVQGYFYGVDSSAKVDLEISFANQTTAGHSYDDGVDLFDKELLHKSSSDVSMTADAPTGVSGYKEAQVKPNPVPLSSSLPSTDEAEDDSLVRKDSVTVKADKDVSSAPGNKTEDLTSSAAIALPSLSSEAHKTSSNDSGEHCIVLEEFIFASHDCSPLAPFPTIWDKRCEPWVSLHVPLITL